MNAGKSADVCPDYCIANNSRALARGFLLRGRCKKFVSKLLSHTSFDKVVGRQFSKKLGGRTIGSTSDSGSDTAPRNTNVLAPFIDTAGTYFSLRFTPFQAIQARY
jgi:hypothetical protein